MSVALDEFIETCQQRVVKTFSAYEQIGAAEKLSAAISYSVMNGGKRIRPLLVYATGYSLDATWENCDLPAAAIELIHTYSLIHDDLPAMDNADLRRGKPACHKAFNEALAILAGDALQPLAFEIIASHPSTLSIEQRLSMIKVLCRASGYQGMVAGQTIDIEGVQTIEQLTKMYALKTGALLSASVKLGFIAANQPDPRIQAALEKYADLLGLAFQLQDDLLDIESHIDITGKPHQLDTENKKITYPILLGIEPTRGKIKELIEQSIEIIEFLGKKADILRAIANYLLYRNK